MESKIILSLTDDKVGVSFEPTLDNESYVTHMNTVLNGAPQALLNLYATVPLLRPACDQERDAHTYVFADGEDGKVENELYKYRKHLYDTTASVFSQLLTAAFPDIEYIEGCKNYQQEFCMSHSEDEVQAYQDEVQAVTTYVRENMEELIKEVFDNVQEEKTE